MEAGGTGLLVFGALPYLDLVRSLLLLNTVSVVPACLELFSSVLHFCLDKGPTTTRILTHPLLRIAGCALLLAMQCSMLFVVLLSPMSDAALNPWYLVAALLLCSTAMSRNYFNSSRPASGKIYYGGTWRRSLGIDWQGNQFIDLIELNPKIYSLLGSGTEMFSEMAKNDYFG